MLLLAAGRHRGTKSVRLKSPKTNKRWPRGRRHRHNTTRLTIDGRPAGFGPLLTVTAHNPRSAREWSAFGLRRA
ncbi:hypothetical protein ZHAS_00019023 [Anopheles sinensis]|uniref:Uncharacterized protein n=1 Tax=Anopheles sinensis TaxID=74873 RepID=A0A084WL85_ANOSI|nr:hypothetical protein ZHAS_00019023 [Anopheles sinensis]